MRKLQDEVTLFGNLLPDFLQGFADVFAAIGHVTFHRVWKFRVAIW